jgi:hypothetical protein
MMRAKGLSDFDLVKFLRLVDLDWMVVPTERETSSNDSSQLQDDKQLESFEQVWKDVGEEKVSLNESDAIAEQDELRSKGQKRCWDSENNWMDVLSGGQKQRFFYPFLFSPTRGLM